MRNLQMAFPEKSAAERRQILRGVYISLGRLLAEFCLFPSYTRENASQIAVYQGFENFEAAEKRGKGVLFLTGHFGGWEVGSFFHSLHGTPDADRGASARQSVCRCIRHSLSHAFTAIRSSANRVLPAVCWQPCATMRPWASSWIPT